MNQKICCVVAALALAACGQVEPLDGNRIVSLADAGPAPVRDAGAPHGRLVWLSGYRRFGRRTAATMITRTLGSGAAAWRRVRGSLACSTVTTTPTGSCSRRAQGLASGGDPGRDRYKVCALRRPRRGGRRR